MRILGIDPGLEGAFGLLTGDDFKFFAMPVLEHDKNREVDFSGVWNLLQRLKPDHIFLERAKPIAMGAKHAFNYGRGFAALEIAISRLELPVTYVEPHVWAKVIHAGISNDIKPKAKSQIAAKRLFPQFVSKLPKGPKSGKILDGPLEALLIAGYGYKQLQDCWVAQGGSRDFCDDF